MSKPVNLKRFRKEKARAEKRARADENAVKHGRTKAQREIEKTRNTKGLSDLSNHERDKE
ncbi:DUF4169 family protein [Roseovarius sp. MMSF_3281]|uniref:DUF4169 family protein n=1 Tax=Roseovarius sp. MMSF_3281 TaxID=3046694 RepID=UPI00273F25E0|nr:DUF4169 family protein [Roseovarius sp. MMSF_3281]